MTIMKRLSIAVLLLIIFTGCSSDITAEKDVNTHISPTPYEIKATYYEVYDITKYCKPQYQYYIFDKEHNVLDYGVTIGTEPLISMMDDIVKLDIDVGIGVNNCIYYDIDKKMTSRRFQCPLAQSGHLVAYLDYSIGAKALIVRNMFDTAAFYRKFERNFSPKQNPASAEFLDNGSQIRITYRTGEDGHKTTEIIDLK
jgi:hypothetical protein